MSFKRKFNRKNIKDTNPHCCGLKMEIKVIDGKAYHICLQCGKTKRYESEE